MASADVDMEIHEADEPRRPGRREAPLPPPTCQVRYYRATELVPQEKGHLHGLLKKQPAVLGSLQMVSGILSVGVGLVFAVTQNMEDSLFTMFRVSHFTGGLYIIAGLVSNLLFKYPALLTVSLAANCGCIIVAAIGAVLIVVDLVHWSSENENQEFLKIELLQLCVLGLEVLLSGVLCFWFFKEKPAKTP